MLAQCDPDEKRTCNHEQRTVIQAFAVLFRNQNNDNFELTAQPVGAISSARSCDCE